MGGSLAHPHVLDGTNYDYWKQMMEIYLTTFNERAWQCIRTGYTPPTIIDEDVVHGWRWCRISKASQRMN